ncbi:hypothetical protein [Mycolicibacterium fortuitum]|uniref:hypothetical protein n=1 Tax=Mycolicibacterium fortuitum TaxID=1766 RepID=UPI00148F82E9|nr:hypothetical protein [Mycolicibacterium fortuitum]
MGQLDTDSAADSSDLFVDDARVVFTDGTEATFDRVEFVSGGRLKATLVTPIDVGGSLVVPVTNIVHYAGGAWKSVHESPRGCLLALVLPAGQPIGDEITWVVEASIREKDVMPHALAWMKQHMHGKAASVQPPLPAATADSDALLGTRFQLSRPVRGWPDHREDYESIVFRWVSTHVHQDAVNSLIV